MDEKREIHQEGPRLRITGILFAFALNLLLVSLAFFVTTRWGWSAGTIVAAMFAIALVAGLATTLYVGPRSGIHAFIGGLLSAPVLALFVLPAGNFPYALLAGSFCAIGGILGEFLHRRRGR